jgi:hypothetical protein
MTAPEPGRARAPAAAAVAGAVAVAMGALLAAAWAVPPLAILAVWPALFVVPGYALIAWSRPRIGSTGRMGLAVVLSVAVSAHLVYWLALATGGYRRETIFAVAAVLLLPIPLAAWRAGPSPFGVQAHAAVAGLRREAGAFAFALSSAVLVGVVLQSGLWAPTAGGVAAGGSNWSDLGVHLSIAQSLNAGNFPPEVPYFAGAPLVYHWFADFHAAIAARSAGLFGVPAFVVSSAVLAGALALLVHGLARRMLRGRGARRAAILAAVLVLLGGGFGWVRLVSETAAGYGDPLTLIRLHSYDNSWYDAAGQVSWPFFRIPSVMGTGLLVHRATTVGLPMLVGAVLLLVSALPSARMRRAGWRDRPELLVLAGVLGSLLAPFHFFFFPAFLLLALAYVALAGRLRDGGAPRHAALLLAPYLLALPFAVAPLLQAGGSGALRLVAGWESAPLDDGPLAVAFFYVTNLGLPFVLAAVAVLLPRTPWRAFLGAWAAILFVIPNVVQVSAIAFDMNKYFQAMWIAVALLAAWLIRRWPLPAVAVVLALAIPSPLLVATWTATNREQVLSTAELEAAAWIAEHTPDGSVFATDGWLNSPTDPAGRLRLLTYTPYVANLGYDPEPRQVQVHAIYCAGDAARSVELLRELDATHVLDGGRPGDCLTPTDFGQASALELIYQNEAVRIWRLTDGGGTGSVSSPS